MAVKFVGLEQLKYFQSKLKDLVVIKEHKTGSEDEWKVLSDNNLTDAMVTKLNDKSYNSLINKPAIDGKELNSTSTSTDLGLAKKIELPKPASTALTGVVKPDGVTIDVLEDGTISVHELSSYLKSEEAASTYLTQSDAELTYDTKENTALLLPKTEASSTYATKTELSEYATSENLGTSIEQAKSELETKIESAVSSVYTPKGSITFDQLPEPSQEIEGDVYNISDAFSIVDGSNWVEGVGGPFPAGTNVVCINIDEAYKWDIIGGFVDLTNYVKTEDLGQYVEQGQLSSYVQRTELEDYVTTESLGTYITESTLDTKLLEYVSKESLGTYATKDELEQYAKVSDIQYVTDEEIDTIFASE